MTYIFQKDYRDEKTKYLEFKIETLKQLRNIYIVISILLITISLILLLSIDNGRGESLFGIISLGRFYTIATAVDNNKFLRKIKSELEYKKMEKINKYLETREKIEEFFKQSPKAQKELDLEIKSRETQINKSKPSKTKVHCGTPYIQKTKEKIYNKYNK